MIKSIHLFGHFLIRVINGRAKNFSQSLRNEAISELLRLFTLKLNLALKILFHTFYFLVISKIMAALQYFLRNYDKIEP